MCKQRKRGPTNTATGPGCRPYGCAHDPRGHGTQGIPESTQAYSVGEGRGLEEIRLSYTLETSYDTPALDLAMAQLYDKNPHLVALVEEASLSSTGALACAVNHLSIMGRLPFRIR